MHRVAFRVVYMYDVGRTAYRSALRPPGRQAGRLERTYSNICHESYPAKGSLGKDTRN